MKLPLIAALSVSLASGLTAAEKEIVLKDQKDKVSYGIGMQIGQNLKRNAIDVDPDLVAAALKATIKGDKTLMTEAEVTQTMMAFQSEMQAKRMEKQKDEGDKNKKAGEAFLAENKKKDGVKVLPVKLPSGETAELQYKVLTMGTGPKPTATDTVVTHYRGTLVDGTEFDSSYKRGEPATFGVTQVIKGWTEALLQMPAGSKWQLFIPGDLAYGPNGRPGIPPSATLLFDIELIKIQDKTDKK